ncbi:hypothetical protein COOONC_17523 [Cooperia oncophora]
MSRHTPIHRNYMIGLGETGILIVLLFYAITRLYSLLVASCFLLLIAGLIISHLAHGKSYWVRQGIPGPKPNIFTGNTTEYENGLHTMDEKWIAEYGNTFG